MPRRIAPAVALIAAAIGAAGVALTALNAVLAEPAVIMGSPILAAPTFSGERGLLWRVVQTCIADKRITGGAFPCLAVDLARGADRGFAVLRAPLERQHIIVTPTVRTIGIEDPRLVRPDAPNYFADAWASRRYVSDDLRVPLPRDRLALAVNSRPGRSQDQLHIHVACVRQDVKRAVAAAASSLKTGHLVPVRVMARSPRYFAMPLSGDDLAGQNPFRIVAEAMAPADMSEVTIVVVGTGDETAPGFVLLARTQAKTFWDNAHGEALLDPSCKA